MKNLKENQKITLTISQLKNILKEASVMSSTASIVESEEDVSKRNWEECSEYIYKLPEAIRILEKVVELSEKANDYDITHNIANSYATSNETADINAQKKALMVLKDKFADLLAQ